MHNAQSTLNTHSELRKTKEITPFFTVSGKINCKLQRNNKRKKKLYNKYMESLESLFTWQLTRVFFFIFSSSSYSLFPSCHLIQSMKFYTSRLHSQRLLLLHKCRKGNETNRRTKKKEERLSEFVFSVHVM